MVCVVVYSAPDGVAARACGVAAGGGGGVACVCV